MTHSKKSENFIKDNARTEWHDESLWWVRQKRDIAIQKVKEWEYLREIASEIKQHALSNLDQYLIEFEKRALENGVKVHWAKDGEAHNKIVHSILQKHQAKKVVKSKSMLTEECQLNPYLEKHGIEVIDTDLGERIIQLRNEAPSHIVLPAIHIKKEEVGILFSEKLKSEPNNSDPTYLTGVARNHLREKFLVCDAAITGVNFAIAETGEVVVCTNEGNADMGVHLAPIQIHSMGIEKVIPKKNHLGIFTRILARSATGQPITVFTSHHKTPKTGGEMHVIIVDNGRSEKLKQEKFWTALKCIRCGACMNTCPIYRRSGGHSYNFTIPGPIGSILAPATDMKKHSDLPFASTLCGSCDYVCPVKIDISHQLYNWRQEIGKAKILGRKKTWINSIGSSILKSEKKYNLLSKLGGFIPDFMINFFPTVWTKQRTLPPRPKQTFRQIFKSKKK